MMPSASCSFAVALPASCNVRRLSSCSTSSSGSDHTRFAALRGNRRSLGRSSLVVKARQSGRRKGYADVELDDDYEQRNFALEFLPLAGGRVLKLASNLADRFVDVVYDFAPAGTSRSVVETATKGTLVLVTVAFANSILSFVVNAGFVLLAGYVATKFFGVQFGFFNSQPPPSIGTGSAKKGGAKKTTRTSTKRASKKATFNTEIGQAAGDLADVWFESKPEPPKRKRTRKPKAE